MTPALLRGAAVLIAVLGVVDPAFRSVRRVRPDVALITSGTAAPELAERTADVLGTAFNVVRGPFTGAAATMLIGGGLSTAALEQRAPVFAVVPDRKSGIVLEHVTAPATTSPDAKTRVTATARITAAAGKVVEFTLQSGTVVLDRATHTVKSDHELLQVPLTFVPAADGVTQVRVEADIAGTTESTAADVAINVRELRFAVLFFDHRPTWQSTFVRRTLADDPRFEVTSRVITSRNVSTDAGRPPATLSDEAAFGAFDLVVVGAPELLSERDVAALDTFMRQRGGSVLLLLDHNAPGPYQRLAGVDRWGETRRGRFQILPVAGTDTLGLKASEAIWPPVLPAGAASVAELPESHAPVVWRTAVGAGRLVVSGALDAWRFRDEGESSFEPFWRDVIAGAAADVVPPIDIAIQDTPVASGAATEVVVTVRDASLPNIIPGRRVHASITTFFETSTGRTSVRLWPDGMAGRFRGVLRAPREPGAYRLVVTSDGAQASAPVLVTADVRRAMPDQSQRLAAFVESRGGRVIPISRLDDLPRELEQMVKGEPRSATLHPLRSAWWIVPFAILLGLEWWLRRNLTPPSGIRTLPDGRGRPEETA